MKRKARFGPRMTDLLGRLEHISCGAGVKHTQTGAALLSQIALRAAHQAPPCTSKELSYPCTYVHTVDKDDGQNLSESQVSR